MVMICGAFPVIADVNFLPRIELQGAPLSVVARQNVNAAPATSIDCATLHDPVYCEYVDKLSRLSAELNQPEPDFDLVELLLTEILKYVATDFGGYFIPYHTVRDIAELRNMITMLFPPELSALISDEMLNAVWDEVETSFTTELDAARNGIDNVAAMTDYMNHLGILAELHLGWFKAFSQMHRMNLQPGYLPPAGDPADPSSSAIVGFPPEYGASEGVLVIWPAYNKNLWIPQAKLIRAVTQAGATAYVLVDNAFFHRAALLTLRDNNGGDMSEFDSNTKVRFIYIPNDWYWSRDNIGYFMTDADGRRVLVGQEYYTPWLPPMPRSAEVNERLADYLGIPYRDITSAHPEYIDEGGNLLSDGEGTVFVMESVFERNPGLTQETLRQIAVEYWGASRLIVLPRVALELVGHIDVVLKVLNAETVAVADTPWNSEMHRDLDALAGILANTRSHGGTGANYNVIRVPVPYFTLTDVFGLIQHSYVNSIIVNDTIIMPGYNPIQDALVRLIYMSAGFKVVKVDAKKYIDGALHCTTKEIPGGTLKRIKR